MNDMSIQLPVLTTMVVRRDHRVLTAALHRPEALNSLNEDVLDDLERLLTFVEGDPVVRVLVLTGVGRAFCVGLDLDTLDGAFASPDVWEALIDRIGGLALRLELLPVPVVCAVNGLTRAGGFELMLACDIVVMAHSARVGDAHTTFGVIPGGGSTVRLPRIVGAARAREIFLTGRWVDAKEAVDIGLVVRAVPDDDLVSTAAQIAADLAGKSRDCLSALKRQLKAVEGLSVEAALPIERRHFVDYVTPADSDGQEGYRAWREERPPTWA